MGIVILHGSRACGDYREKSDIDLAISGEGIHDFIGIVEEECPTLLQFDFMEFSDDRISESTKKNIFAEGVVLYDGSDRR